MNSRYHLIPSSSANCGSAGYFKYAVEMIPTDLSRPAGVNTVAIDDALLARNWVGCQSISKALRMAWAATLLVVALKKTFAPEPFSVTIWESTVGSVTS